MKHEITTTSAKDVELPTGHVIPGTKSGGALTVDSAEWNSIQRKTPWLSARLAIGSIECKDIPEPGDEDEGASKTPAPENKAQAAAPENKKRSKAK